MENNMKKHMIPFATVAEGNKELLDLAFSKKKPKGVAPSAQGERAHLYLLHCR
jgi:hypothetical protein